MLNFSISVLMKKQTTSWVSKYLANVNFWMNNSFNILIIKANLFRFQICNCAFKKINTTWRGVNLKLSDHCWCWICTFRINSRFAPKAGHSPRTDGGWAEHGVLKQLRVSPACIAVSFGLMGIGIRSWIPTLGVGNYCRVTEQYDHIISV